MPRGIVALSVSWIISHPRHRHFLRYNRNSKNALLAQLYDRFRIIFIFNPAVSDPIPIQHFQLLQFVQRSGFVDFGFYLSTCYVLLRVRILSSFVCSQILKVGAPKTFQRHLGGQMQQTNAAATALYDHAGGGSLQNAAPAGDAVMARWLQSAGLQHLASPLASTGIDNRLLPNILMQYGAQSAEEKKRLFKLMRSLNFYGESGVEPYTSTSQTLGSVVVPDGSYSPDFLGDFGAGLLDLHSMDDTELLSEI